MCLLFGPQSNRLGLFFFSVHTAADDLNTTAETLRKGLADVAGTCGWHFDAEASVFYILTLWKWNPVENPNVMKGALKDLAESPPCGPWMPSRRTSRRSRTNQSPRGGLFWRRSWRVYRNVCLKVRGLRSSTRELSGTGAGAPRFAQGGSERKNVAGRSNGAADPPKTRIETLARRTLTFATGGQELDTLVDTFYSVVRVGNYQPNVVSHPTPSVAGVNTERSHANAVPVAMPTSQVSTGAAPGLAPKNDEPI